MLVEPVQAGGPMQPSAGRKWAFVCRNEAQFLARGPGFLRCRICEQGCCGPVDIFAIVAALGPICGKQRQYASRSEEHTSELQSLMRISYAVFCLKKKNKKPHIEHTSQQHKTRQDKKHIKTKTHVT